MQAELSILDLFLNASVLVQAIMGGLLVLSLLSWLIIGERFMLYRSAKSHMKRFEQTFWSGVELSRLFSDINGRQGTCRGLELIFHSGFKEFVRLRKQSGTQPEAVMDGSRRAMKVAMSREVEQLERSLSFLATVGSTSPYIGLFGTVWGIMHSFIALGNVQQATLSMVAPGIAEALVATAMGLFAAIPAVIAFNRFSSRLEWLENRYDNFMEEFTTILHRQAHSNYASLNEAR